MGDRRMHAEYDAEKWFERYRKVLSERNTAHARIAELEAQAGDYKRGMLTDRARVAELEAVLRDWLAAIETDGIGGPSTVAFIRRTRALLEGK